MVAETLPTKQHLVNFNWSVLGDGWTTSRKCGNLKHCGGVGDNENDFSLDISHWNKTNLTNISRL